MQMAIVINLSEEEIRALRNAANGVADHFGSLIYLGLVRYVPPVDRFVFPYYLTISGKQVLDRLSVLDTVAPTLLELDTLNESR